jgi:RIO kinase 2
MKALHDNGFPTPIPLDCNRHCVLMSLVKGIQLQHVAYLRNPRYVYDQVWRARVYVRVWCKLL